MCSGPYKVIAIILSLAGWTEVVKAGPITSIAADRGSTVADTLVPGPVDVVAQDAHIATELSWLARTIEELPVGDAQADDFRLLAPESVDAMTGAMLRSTDSPVAEIADIKTADAAPTNLDAVAIPFPPTFWTGVSTLFLIGAIYLRRRLMQFAARS